MKKVILSAAILSSVLMLQSCATMFSTSKTDVSLQGTPGAAVTVTNRKGKLIYQGTTPATVRLKNSSGYMRGESYTILATKDGQTQTQTLEAHVRVGYWFNAVPILLGGSGLLGFLIIDPLTGAMYNLDAEIVNINLAPGTTYNQLPTQLQEKATFIGYVNR